MYVGDLSGLKNLEADDVILSICSEKQTSFSSHINVKTVIEIVKKVISTPLAPCLTPCDAFGTSRGGVHQSYKQFPIKSFFLLIVWFRRQKKNDFLITLVLV